MRSRGPTSTIQAKHLPHAEEDDRDSHQDHQDPDRQSPGHVGRKRRSLYPADDQTDNDRPEFEAIVMTNVAEMVTSPGTQRRSSSLSPRTLHCLQKSPSRLD